MIERRQPSLPAPLLFRFSLHRRASRVLHLEPIGRAARSVGRVLALRDDALEPDLADCDWPSGLTTTSPFVAAATQFCIANGLDTSRTQSTNVWTTGVIVRPFKVTMPTGQERIGRSTGNTITEDAAPL